MVNGRRSFGLWQHQAPQDELATFLYNDVCKHTLKIDIMTGVVFGPLDRASAAAFLRGADDHQYHQTGSIPRSSGLRRMHLDVILAVCASLLGDGSCKPLSQSKGWPECLGKIC